MFVRLKMMMVLIFLIIFAQAHASDDAEQLEYAAQSAYKSGDFRAAKQYAIEAVRLAPHSYQLMSEVGDAAFRLNASDAYAWYAKAWAEDLYRAYGETKGNSGFRKVLAKLLMVTAAAADYGSAKHGISSNNLDEAMEANKQLMKDATNTMGDNNHRKAAKRVMRDMRKLSERSSSTIQVIRPVWTTVAGAGMVRVYVGDGVCTGMRLAPATFDVAASCLERFGRGEAGMIVSTGTTLRPDEFSKVVTYRVAGSRVVLEIAPEKTDLATSDWKPRRGEPVYGQAFGVTWFAPEFDYIVPVFQECSSDKFDDCGDLFGNSAALWMKANETGAWFFYGFADRDGHVVRVDP